MKRAPLSFAMGRGAGLMAACALLGGCLVYDVASVPVKVAVGTAEAAGGLAVGTAKVVGSVAIGAIELAARLARDGVVTFVDLKTGAVTRVAWRRGLTLAGAGDSAKVRMAQRAIEIVREGKIVFSAPAVADENPPVAAGDVVELGK